MKPFPIMLLVYMHMAGVTPLYPCFGKTHPHGLEFNLPLPSCTPSVFFPFPFSSFSARKMQITSYEAGGWGKMSSPAVPFSLTVSSMLTLLHLNLKSKFFLKTFSYFDANHIYSSPVLVSKSSLSPK